MPPEDEREEEEAHIKTDRRASRDAGEESVEEEKAEEAEEPAAATGQEPEAEEGPAEPAGEPAVEEEEPPAEEAAEDEEALPEITVYGLLRMSIGMYAEQAWIHMGVRMDPRSQKTEQNLPLAKVAVDTVAFLVEQLQPDLSEGEKRELESLVANLRINYVQRS